MALLFSFDLGTSSIGWAVYRLTADGALVELMAAGVRIFPDGREPSSEGRTGESLAKKRRDARGPRRRRDRFVQRRRHLLTLLVANRLLPRDERARRAMVDEDPIAIRKRALSEPVSLHEFGRALFHLNQRRGFKSNRKTDEPDDKGKISIGAAALGERLDKAGHESLGSLYAGKQRRRVVNALIARHGRPHQVVLELARDLKQSQKQKQEDVKRNTANRAANERRRKELLKEGLISEGDRGIGEYLQRMRLCEELAKTPTDRRCPYTGEQISLRRLISDEVEIEHILPRSRTLDDSIANKTVSMRSADRLKRALSPAEAAEHYRDHFDLDAVMARASAMPANKRWRFRPDAMDRFRDEASFLDRQLNETRHFSRLAAAYARKLNPGLPRRPKWTCGRRPGGSPASCARNGDCICPAIIARTAMIIVITLLTPASSASSTAPW